MILKGYKKQFLIAIIVITGIRSLIIKMFSSTEDMITYHIVYLANLINSLLVLKYLISQNPNLKSYVSVYHHQPPPVLPWQLADNFDPGDIKLIVVKKEHE